tara:strand:+ start:9224 stop:9835 length:612 start_codon:yes stop_codon:yes gene_type:complete
MKTLFLPLLVFVFCNQALAQEVDIGEVGRHKDRQGENINGPVDEGSSNPREGESSAWDVENGYDTDAGPLGIFKTRQERIADLESLRSFADTFAREDSVALFTATIKENTTLIAAASLSALWAKMTNMLRASSGTFAIFASAGARAADLDDVESYQEAPALFILNEQWSAEEMVDFVEWNGLEEEFDSSVDQLCAEFAVCDSY